MENVTKVSGTCAYCGQAVFIQPKVGEELSEHDLDMMATDMCTCAQASSERRKRERKEIYWKCAGHRYINQFASQACIK